ncbi:MAG: SDR family NAD(P)-dependent oxidoreductase, partial [Actinomycetota bacterium]
MTGNPESSSLRDKVLLLSGASRGVGECVARLAVERGAAGLALVGRDTKTGEKLAAELEKLGTRTIFISADLGEADEPSRIVGVVD